MPFTEREQDVVQALVDALTAALLESTRLRLELLRLNGQAADLEAAVSRATESLRSLRQPDMSDCAMYGHGSDL